MRAVPSLSDQAYRFIKHKIVTAPELPPGSAINESLLKDELGVGRKPIREALQRPAREDLVMILSRRGRPTAPRAIAHEGSLRLKISRCRLMNNHNSDSIRVSEIYLEYSKYSSVLWRRLYWSPPSS